MKKIAVALAITFLFGSFSEASQGRLAKSCQSQGTYEGVIYWVNLWLQDDSSYTAVISSSASTVSPRTPVVTFRNIRFGKTAFSGQPALVNGSGLEFTTDPDDLASSTIKFDLRGKELFLNLVCGTVLK